MQINDWLKGRFLFFLVPLLMALGAVVFIAFNVVTGDVINALGQSVTEKQVLYDRARSITPIVREITLAERLAKSTAVLAWARNETDPLLKQ